MKRYKLREFKIKLEKNVKFENRWCIFGLKNVFYRKGCTFSCCLKHYLVQSTENLELKPSTLNLAFLISIFLHEVMFVYFGGKFSNESSLILLAKKLLGKTLCKLEQIFPPKVLVYTRKVFLDTFQMI